MIGNTFCVSSGLEGIVDVGIVVIAHFRNPARRYAAQLLREAITLKRRIVIPLSAYMGAYIIMTRYLGLKREKVARSLLETLTLESPAFYESIPKTVAERAILSASELNLSSWDTYLVELAKALEISRIYSVDEELARKVKDLDVMNPIPDSVMDKYHRFLERRIS